MAERAGRWIRVSGDTQSEADQMPDINFYCDERGYIKDKPYEVHGKSAYKGAQDPDWQKVVRDFEDGVIDVVVLWMVDRLDRQNILHAVPMVLAVLNAGGRIEFSEQPECNLDANDPRLDERVKAFTDRINAANAESKVKSKRILKKQRKLRAQGSVVGRPPWGYEIVCRGFPACDGHKCGHVKVLVPTDTGRRYVPLIFQAVIDGRSLRWIAKWLDSENVPTVRGGKWNEGFLAHRLIRNTTYYGQRPNAGNLEVEALVSVTTWQEANAAIATRVKMGRGTTKREPALLYPVCGACYGTPREGCPSGTSPMYRIYPGKGENRPAYYRCTGHGPQRKGCGAPMILASELDERVTEAMESNQSRHPGRDFIPGDDRSDEIQKLRNRGADLGQRGDYQAAMEAFAEAKRLEGLPRIAPHWEERDTGQTEASYFSGLSLSERREYLARHEVVAQREPDAEIIISIVPKDLV